MYKRTVQIDRVLGLSRVSPVQTRVGPVQSRVGPVQTRFSPVQTRSTPVQPRFTPVQPRSTPVQTQLPQTQTQLPQTQTQLPPTQTNTRSRSPGASDSLTLASDRRPFGDKYCSCVFKVTGSNYRKQYPASPYAICSSSIYNRKGMKGPGSSIRCTYPPEYLDRLSYGELIDFAAAKGILSDDQTMEKEDVKRIILEWQNLEKEIRNRRKPVRGWLPQQNQ